MAIETPVEVLRRLREENRQQQLQEQSAAVKRTQSARPGRDRAFAFGQNLGGALAQGAVDEVTGKNAPEESEVYKQAKRRSEWLGVAPDDVAGIKQNIKAANDAEDYEAAKYLTDMYYRAKAFQLQEKKINADANKGGKSWKYKTFTATDTKLLAPQVQNAMASGNLEKSQIEPATNAVVSAAENLWNLRREQGDDTFTKQEAMEIATKFASNYIVDDWGMNSFDSAKFSSEFANVVGQARGISTGVSDGSGQTGPAKAVVRKGTRKGDYIFIGETGDDPNDKSNWKKIGKGKPKDKQKDGETSNLNQWDM